MTTTSASEAASKWARRAKGSRRLTASGPSLSRAGRGDLPAQVVGSKEADRPQTTGRGDGRGELVPRQAAAHAGLNDRQLYAKSLQQGAHAPTV